MVTLDAGPAPDYSPVGWMISALVVLALTWGWFDEDRLERAYMQVRSDI
jgi:hypothetical protein